MYLQADGDTEWPPVLISREENERSIYSVGEGEGKQGQQRHCESGENNFPFLHSSPRGRGRTASPPDSGEQRDCVRMALKQECNLFMSAPLPFFQDYTGTCERAVEENEADRLRLTQSNAGMISLTVPGG